MKKLKTKSELSRLVNVSPAAITGACNKSLKDAMSGKLIDINHPLVIKYIKRKQLQQAKKNQTENNDKIVKTEPVEEIIKKVKKVKNEPETKKPHVRGHNAAKETKKNTKLSEIEIPEHIRKYEHYTLREIIEEFGTETAFTDFLTAIQKIENIEEKRIKNASSSGELVHKDLIKIGIIDPINTVHTRMLTDGSNKIVKRVIAKHESGSEIYELEKLVASILTSFIKPMTQTIKRTLKNVEANK